MKLIHLNSIDSTNKHIKDNYPLFDNFTFVSASFQTNGKGRQNRKWFAEKNKNLLFSFLIKNKNLLKEFKCLSIGTAALIARFLELKGFKNVFVKWPNDVYVGDKKICGILLEGDLTNYVVVGVGLNVNQIIFEGEYRVTPTSLKLESNNDFDLNDLGFELFSFLEKHINQRTFKDKTYKFLLTHNYLLNKNVTINNVNGIVNGIDKDFNILIDEKPYQSGEVDILKIIV